MPAEMNLLCAIFSIYSVFSVSNSAEQPISTPIYSDLPNISSTSKEADRFRKSSSVDDPGSVPSTSSSLKVNISSLLRNNGTLDQISYGGRELSKITNNTTTLPLLYSNDSYQSNKTILDSTPNSTDRTSEKKIDTELQDLLDSDFPKKEDISLGQQHPFEPQESVQIPDKIDKEIGFIDDDDGKNTEDELRRHRNDYVPESSQGPLAITLVSMFVGSSVLCYASLLLWRKYLENRYGSRTLLVDAEELADPNDLGHFSI